MSHYRPSLFECSSEKSKSECLDFFFFAFTVCGGVVLLYFEKSVDSDQIIFSLIKGSFLADDAVLSAFIRVAV